VIISEIIKRLRLKLPEIGNSIENRIAGAAEFALVSSGKKTRLVLPCIYIFHDRTSTERIGVAKSTQIDMEITEYFVLRAIFSNTDRRGQFSQDQTFALRLDILKSFLGWAPTLDPFTGINEISARGMELFEDKSHELTEETYSHDYTINFSYDVYQELQGIGSVMPDSTLEDLLRIRGELTISEDEKVPKTFSEVDY